MPRMPLARWIRQKRFSACKSGLLESHSGHASMRASVAFSLFGCSGKELRLETLTAKRVLLMLFNIAVVTTAQLCLKHGMLSSGADLSGSIPNKVRTLVTLIFTNPFVFSGFLLFGASSLMWLNILKTTPLSLAYPTMALTYIIVTVVMSRQEHVNWIYSGPGLLFILAGVTLVGLGFAQKAGR